MFSWSLHTTRFLPDPFCTLFGHVSKHAHCKFQDTYHALFRRAQHVKAYNEFVKEHLTSRFLREHVGRCWVTSLLSILHFIWSRRATQLPEHSVCCLTTLHKTLSHRLFCMSSSHVTQYALFLLFGHATHPTFF